MVELSAVLITLNEERRLPRALESLAGLADEILVVDSGSADRTREIATAHGARVISHPWEGYARQKNFAASQAKFDWILARRRRSRNAGARRRAARDQDSWSREATGFRMPRLACYRGRWIRRSGWYPDHKLRLYDRRRARWVGDYVHESVAVDGAIDAASGGADGGMDAAPVRTLRGDLQHFTCDSLAEHFRTVDRYTTLAAQEAYAQRNGPGGRWLLPRAVAMTVAGPPWKFFETYFLRQGFRDGFSGLLIAAMAAFYVFWKYAKLCELLRDRHLPQVHSDTEGQESGPGK